MQLGISSYSYSWAVGVDGYPPEKPMRLLDLIEQTHAFGLSLLQIGDNLPVDELADNELADAKRALQEYGITIELGIRGLLDDQLKTYVELCRYFSAGILRVVIDRGDFQPSVDEIVEILKRWAPVLEENGVVLAIENHDRLKVKQFVEVLERTHSDAVGICLDSANSLGALEGLETVLTALVPYTVNLHAKDITIARLPSQLGFQITGTVSGEGMLDMTSLISQVMHNGHDANCILEQWTPFTHTLEETIAKEARDAARGVENLKRMLRDAH